MSEDVAKHYGLGPRFVDDYLKRQIGDDYNEKYRNLQDLFAKVGSLRRMYLEFALSSNLRGSQTVNQLRPYFKSFHKNSIDVGCAYGGFVVAFAKAGFDAYGLELDEQFAHYGKLNCEDHGINDRISVGNILNTELEVIGKFDIITCNDVIEHVSDVESALFVLCKMLNNMGLLNMVIPNRDAISFVESDGHFQLFGITLLERNQAKQYKYEMTSIEDNYDHMGEYFPIDYYIDKLASNNMAIQKIGNHTLSGLEETPLLLSKLTKAFQNWVENDRNRISSDLAKLISDKYSAYLHQLNIDYDAALASGESEYFETTYLSSFWDIVAIKNSEPIHLWRNYEKWDDALR